MELPSTVPCCPTPFEGPNLTQFDIVAAALTRAAAFSASALDWTWVLEVVIRVDSPDAWRALGGHRRYRSMD